MRIVPGGVRRGVSVIRISDARSLQKRSHRAAAAAAAAQAVVLKLRTCRGQIGGTRSATSMHLCEAAICAVTSRA